MKPSKFIFQRLYESAFIRFGVIGAIGFFSDVCALYALRHILPLISAKIISYIVAFSVTWILNRYFTFRSRDPQRLQQWLKYVALYVVTGCLNVGMFGLLVQQFPYLYQHPIFAMIITSIAMMMINFTVSRGFVFKFSAVVKHI
ncbi:hypothetical protein BH10PSE19_BH10PSE19_17170 [soil metagenome]